MALSTPIQRTRVVAQIQAGQAAGTYQVTFTVQPTASTPGYNQVEILSQAEMNAVVAESGGGPGVGTTLTTSSQ